MKTLKANNFSQAVKELESLDAVQAKKLSDEIREFEKNYHHVIGVKIESRPGEAKNKVIPQMMIINDDKLKKLEKNYQFMGFTKLIILHNGTQPAKEGSENESNGQGSGLDQKTDVNVFEVHAEAIDLTVSELKDLAEEKGIDLSGLKNKTDIQLAIATWMEENK